MSGLLNFGRRQAQIAAAWLNSAATYGAVGSAALVYFTDWKVIAAYIPFYSGKFPSTEPES